MDTEEIASLCVVLSIQENKEPLSYMSAFFKEVGERKLALCLSGRVMASSPTHERCIVPHGHGPAPNIDPHAQPLHDTLHVSLHAPMDVSNPSLDNGVGKSSPPSVDTSVLVNGGLDQCPLIVVVYPNSVSILIHMEALSSPGVPILFQLYVLPLDNYQTSSPPNGNIYVDIVPTIPHNNSKVISVLPLDPVTGLSVCSDPSVGVKTPTTSNSLAASTISVVSFKI
ncbi:hypothetical protein ACOSP7_007421 [Xanthoceras sorbifolium]